MIFILNTQMLPKEAVKNLLDYSSKYRLIKSFEKKLFEKIIDEEVLLINEVSKLYDLCENLIINCPIDKTYSCASQNHKNSEDMPETLREAILCFLIGLADGFVKGEDRNRGSIRTMYIHPDREIIHHDLYKRWVERFLQDQIDGISINDVQNTIKNLKKSYDDIQSTFKNISKFDKIIERLPHAIYKLLAGGVLSYNGETLGEYDHFPWSHRYGWIVIGGDKLERGFTVEGCTVTYMPRVAKINNQDTVIQRGRFLGYRKKYIDLCRLYLDYDIKEIFENYHTSEEQLETFFKQFNKKQEKEGIDLNLRNETRLLSMYAVNTRITRRNILAQKPKFIDIGGWSYANFPDQISSEDLSKNRKIYNEIYNNLDRENFGLKEYINLAEIDKSVKLREWTEKRIKPKYTLNFSAKKLIKYLINFHFSDSEHDKTLRKQLIFYLDKASKLSEKLAIIQMKADERSIYNSDGIPIFSPLGGPDKADSDKIVRDYPGDRKIKSPNIPTLLLYKLNIKEKSNDKNLIKENVPVLAINFPQRHNTIGVYN